MYIYPARCRFQKTQPSIFVLGRLVSACTPARSSELGPGARIEKTDPCHAHRDRPQAHDSTYRTVTSMAFDGFSWRFLHLFYKP